MALLTARVIRLPDFGLILLASLPASLARPGRRRDQACLPEDQQFLVAGLADHFLGAKPRHLYLCRGPLGQPQLHLEGGPGPAVSFSRGGGRLWAGLAATGNRVGIDVASPEEFVGSYPYHKVFGEDEWRQATVLTDGVLSEAAAMLWSVKEAAVKATGCGFHFFGPRQVRVEFKADQEPGLCWEVLVPSLPPDRSFPNNPVMITVVSRRLDQVWLAVAGVSAAEARKNARAA